MGLSKANINIQPTFLYHPPTPSEICGLGILLYGVTSNGHRIAATSMLKIPPQADDRTLLDQIRTVGDEVVRKFAKQLGYGGVVDGYLADQLVIFMALGSSGVGPSELMEVDSVSLETKETSRSEILVGEVSLHTQSAMRVAEVMLRNIVFSTETIEGVGSVIICERKRDN